MSVDTTAFDAAMARQKAEARKAWSGSGEAATETVWFGLREKVGVTEFLGYEAEDAEGVVAAIVADGAEVSSIAAGQKGAIILNQTPFYGESGGQVGDTGVMVGEGVRFRVTETQKKLGDLLRAPWRGRGGDARRRRAAGAVRGSPPPRRDPRQPFGHAPAA